MKFSIITPLYNGAKFIECTLDSVMAQTYTNYEVILVNDESPDNVGEIVKEYIAKHPERKFVYLEQKNKGLGGARNTAIRHATGEIIAILDQDDLWFPRKLEKVAAIYEKIPEVAIVSHSQKITKQGKIIGVNQPGLAKKDLYRQLLFEGNSVSTSATTFRYSMIKAIGNFSEDRKNLHLCEDYDLWLRAAQAGFKFHFLPEILGEYVRHEGNYAALDSLPMIKADLFIVSRYYDKLEHKSLVDWLRLRWLKANLLSRIAYLISRSTSSRIKALPFLVRAIVSNPLVLFILIKRKIMKLRKEIT